MSFRKVLIRSLREGRQVTSWGLSIENLTIGSAGVSSPNPNDSPSDATCASECGFGTEGSFCDADTLYDSRCLVSWSSCA